MTTAEAPAYEGTTAVETLSEPTTEPGLKAALDATFSASALKYGEVYRSVYSRDASYYEYYPEAVVRLADAEDAASLLRIAHEQNTHITFRAGGTSLSGQTIGTGLIGDTRLAFKSAEVRDGGSKIWFEPALTVDQINHILEPHGRKIGPDPASSRAAMLGGVLSNNSSGMQAGTEFNSYHTLSSIEFILPNGHRYDTANADDRARFARDDKDIHDGLASLRDEIQADADLTALIKRKYQIKCVTGYSINAFVDFEEPIDIFAHVLIGSEGTLAFIASAVLNTLVLDQYHSAALLFFHFVTDAAAAVVSLAESGADAIELMDLASLRSVIGKPGVPALCSTLPEGAASLLVDYQAETPEVLAAELEAARKLIAGFNLIDAEPFTTTPEARHDLWAVREGIMPSVSSARKPGTTLVLEDAAVPPAHLAELVHGLQERFVKYGYDGAINGHAKAGNMHFFVTDDMRVPERVANLGAFLEDVVELVLSLDGSLKAEHGTGRAIAPFVEREWGSQAYSVMTRLKKLVDPNTIMNPGVLISDDPHAHLAHIKSMEVIGDVMFDKCIECGFCEHVCPTRYITLTPRQRIISHRVELALEKAGEETRAAALRHEYEYEGRDTCVADGMCSNACPVGINTAYLTDHDREESTPKSMHRLMKFAAKHYRWVEDGMRLALDSGVVLDDVAGNGAMPWITQVSGHLFPGFPQWSKNMSKAPDRPHTNPASPDVVYFPSCVTRMMGSSEMGKDSVMDTVLRVGDRAGQSVYLPKDTVGLCCSQIWGHTGFDEGRAVMANRLVEAMWEWSSQGSVPVMCDVTSCARTMMLELRETNFDPRQPVLSPENLAKYEKLKVIDIAEWLHDAVLPNVQVTSPKGSVVIHPTCACHEIGLDATIQAIGSACATEATVPWSATCCGAGGDRGFLHPEDTESALHDEQRELEGRAFDGAYSFAKTCEVVLTDRMPYQYESIIYLVDETTSQKG